MAYTYEYPRPAVTVDALLFLKKEDDYHLLLIQRKHEPFRGKWALPGGFVDKNEDPDDSVYRELEEETNLKKVSLKQFHTYGAFGRDPRGHVVSVIYWGFIEHENANAIAGDDAQNARWFSIKELPPMAFDHNKIVKEAINHLL